MPVQLGACMLQAPRCKLGNTWRRCEFSSTGDEGAPRGPSGPMGHYARPQAKTGITWHRRHAMLHGSLFCQHPPLQVTARNSCGLLLPPLESNLRRIIILPRGLSWSACSRIAPDELEPPRNMLLVQPWMHRWGRCQLGAPAGVLNWHWHVHI